MKLIDEFLKYIRYELNLSTHTVLSYKKDLNQLMDFLDVENQESFDLKTLTSGDVRAWVVSMSKSGMSMRSIRRKIQALRSLYRYAIKNEIVEVSPIEEIELAKASKRLPEFVRAEKMAQLLNSDVDVSCFEDVRNRLVIEMFYETGIRRAELIGLEDVNVDTERCEIKVHGKRDKDRIIPIGESLAGLINNYRIVRNKEVGSTEYFFVRLNGEPLYPSKVYKIVHESLEGLGVDKKSPHVLRHSFASAMLNNGAEINSVKELLGHQSLAATQVYTHVTISELKQNYQQAHPRAFKKGG